MSRLLPLAAALAVLVAGLPRPAAAQDPPPAPAPPEVPAEEPPADPVAEARRLRDEAKAFFRTAGDTDLSREERRTARREAYSRLQRARGLLDAWLATRPDGGGAIEELYGDIATTMFWLRKEAGVGEFVDGGARPRPPEPPPPPEPAPAEPGAPAAPEPPAAADVLGEIRAYEASHPGDVPGLHERYSRFLNEFPDPSTVEYEEAVRRMDALGRRLKDVYRRARDDDPDALADADPAEVARLVDQLAPDLRSPEPALRARAARFLGGLGSGKAAPALVDALLAEGHLDALEEMQEALAKIGGRRVCDRLAREKPGGGTAPAVVRVLLRMVRLGGVNARIAGETVAAYAPDLEPERRAEVADALRAAGREGAMGLSAMVECLPAARKPGILEHLGTAGDPRVARNLARSLAVNPKGARRAQLRAAVGALLALGKPAVRHLIPALDDPGRRAWTAEVLARITGVRLRDGKRTSWEKWFRDNRRALEGR